MGQDTDVINLLADAIAPVVVQGMLPSIKKTLFGNFKMNAVQIGYVFGISEAITGHFYLTEEIGRKVAFRIMHQNFRTDLFYINPKIHAYPEEYYEGMAAGRDRFYDSWRDSELIANLGRQIFETIDPDQK
jgi:hypothetical protein